MSGGLVSPTERKHQNTFGFTRWAAWVQLWGWKRCGELQNLSYGSEVEALSLVNCFRRSGLNTVALPCGVHPDEIATRDMTDTTGTCVKSK